MHYIIRFMLCCVAEIELHGLLVAIFVAEQLVDLDEKFKFDVRLEDMFGLPLKAIGKVIRECFHSALCDTLHSEYLSRYIAREVVERVPFRGVAGFCCHIPFVCLLLSRQIFVSLAAVNFLTRCKVKQEISSMQEISQEKSPIKQKILLYLAEIGMSAADFYRKSGVTRGVLAQNNGISEDNIARFFKCFPEVNPSWLILGEGNMTLDKPLNQESQVEKREISSMQDAPLFFSELLATIERQAKEIGRLEAELAETKKHAERLAALVNTDSTAHVG